MPYTICVNKPGCLPEASPCAVATLDEARERAGEEVAQSSYRSDSLGEGAWGEREQECYNLPEAGAVIGPLPDGYVIDVTYVTWDELAALAGITGDYARPEPEDMDEILHIYNHQGD